MSTNYILNDNQNLTEWQTRKKLIDKSIEKRDWNVNNKNQVVHEYLIDWGIDQNGNPVNDRFVDYLLF